MTTFAEDLRSYIVASTSIADALGTTVAVHYNHVPQAGDTPFIWYRTAVNNVPRTLDGAGGLREAILDLEVVADKESTLQSLADKVHDRLDGVKRTTMTNTSVQGLFLEDKGDDYEPKSIGDDEGRHVASYTIRAWYTT